MRRYDYDNNKTCEKCLLKLVLLTLVNKYLFPSKVDNKVTNR